MFVIVYIHTELSRQGVNHSTSSSIYYYNLRLLFPSVGMSRGRGIIRVVVVVVVATFF